MQITTKRRQTSATEVTLLPVSYRGRGCHLVCRQILLAVPESWFRTEGPRPRSSGAPRLRSADSGTSFFAQHTLLHTTPFYSRNVLSI